MLTVGASSTLAPLARASSPSRRPTRPISSRFHVDARAVPQGSDVELVPVNCVPRAPLGPSVTPMPGDAEPVDAGRVPHVGAGGERGLLVER